MLTIEPTGAVLGATIRGIDLAQPLGERISRKSCSLWASTACCGSPASISTLAR